MARTLDEILQSLADVMFPAELGERRVNIDSIGYDGDTPLHVLAWRNDAEGIGVLLAAGANADAQGEMGETPLHIALAQGNAAVVRALLNAGARDDIRCAFGDTPRERALSRGADLAGLFGK